MNTSFSEKRMHWHECEDRIERLNRPRIIVQILLLYYKDVEFTDVLVLFSQYFVAVAWNSEWGIGHKVRTLTAQLRRLSYRFLFVSHLMGVSRGRSFTWARCEQLPLCCLSLFCVCVYVCGSICFFSFYRIYGYCL